MQMRGEKLKLIFHCLFVLFVRVDKRPMFSISVIGFCLKMCCKHDFTKQIDFASVESNAFRKCTALGNVPPLGNFKRLHTDPHLHKVPP